LDGAQGVAGPTGPMFQILDELTDLAELDEQSQTAEQGDAYVVDGELYVREGDNWRHVGRIQGPTGPTGPQPANGFNGISIGIYDGAYAMVSANAPVPFDTVVSSTSEDLSFNTETGEVNISIPGAYLVHWWLTISGCDAPDGVTQVGLVVGGMEQPMSLTAMPLVNGQLSGMYLLQVSEMQLSEGSVTVSLVNKSNGTFRLSNTTVQGSLIIFG